MSQDRTEIEAVVQTYLDGLYEGDVDKLAAAFHPTSSLTYEENGVLTPLPRDRWLEAVRERPLPKAFRRAAAGIAPASWANGSFTQEICGWIACTRRQSGWWPA